jgi:hypothetical protein
MQDDDDSLPGVRFQLQVVNRKCDVSLSLLEFRSSLMVIKYNLHSYIFRWVRPPVHERYTNPLSYSIIITYPCTLVRFLHEKVLKQHYVFVELISVPL